MTDQQIFAILSLLYFTVMGSLGFYLLWREWQWTKKEAKPYEKRTLSAKTKGE